MFSQGSPVLAGVDLDSGYLFALGRRWNRAADDWADVLGKYKDQDLELATTVQDAARGIAAGARSVFPKAERRDATTVSMPTTRWGNSHDASS